MTINLDHTVRKKYRRTMLIDGVSVRLDSNTATLTGENPALAIVAFHLPKWLHDGMFEGSPLGLGKYATGVAYE